MGIFTKKTLGLCSVLLTTALSAQAIEEPVAISPETLTHGGKYVLINPANINGYHSRTSWDGALYFLGPNDSNYANHALEAVQNEDGTWSFIQTAEDGSKKFMLLPEGSANINMGDSAVWSVEEGAMAGYYWLKAGDGNNSNAVGLYMHLNAGQQYFVISYNGGPWYPDYTVKTDEEGFQIVDELTGNYQMADSTSLNWGFVTVENLQNYTAKKSAYNAIVAYDTTYCKKIEEYATGFELGCQAAEAIYNNEAFGVDMVDSLNAILNAKVALYNKILGAMDENTTTDATLNAAIDAAKGVFNASAKAEEMNASITALEQALAAYEQSFGDLTTLGQNMSFEDLSAQDGKTTTGVGAAPAGWNLYFNGVQCQTLEEVKAAGLGAWCGVNADCTGEAKDGNYGFGIWNQGMPSTEISQTITGLENGTYEISAALMVGANGNGSRRTTQRIFGNLNSTYFGSEGEYNTALLDQSEVYGFAGLVEPVTDTEMQLITVRAYVYDGTLTFGFRTDNNVAAANRSTSNTAGGDGWFKIDNFRIQKVGYNAQDVQKVVKHFDKVLGDLALAETPCYTPMTDKLIAGWLKCSELPNDASQEEVTALIIECTQLIAEVAPYKDAYKELGDALSDAFDNLAVYGNMPGANVYAETISEVEANYNEGVYDLDAVSDAILRLEEALEACKKSEITVGKDVTYLIANPSFENQLASQPNGDTGGVADAPKGWTLILDGDTCKTVADITAHGISAWCGINGGDAIKVGIAEGDTIYRQPTDGEKLWGIWNSNMPEVELSQTLTDLPKGTYTLTADVMVEHNWAGNNITTQRIFANNCVQMFSSFDVYANNLPADAALAGEIDLQYPDINYVHLTYADYACEASSGAFTSLLRAMKVTFCVDETGKAHIGFRTNGINSDGLTFAEGGRNGQGWFKVDNFRLTYDSEEISAGIEDISADATVVNRQYFTADGVQIAAPAQGVTIVKEILNNGQTRISKLMK